MEIKTLIVKVDIVFRVDKTRNGNGEVFALFPHDCCNHNGNVTSYQHVGQHSSANYKHCLEMSKPATPEQYADLLKELESIGYEVNIVKKQNYEKFLKSYKKVWKFD
jgi:acyl-CoA thioesterase